jgi:choline dehydrogenase-like flavoprotein
MEIDLAQLDSNPIHGGDSLRAEICIVGGGIAGLTLGHKLVQLGHEVVLLEAGGLQDEARPAEVLQRGELHRGTAESRVTAWGGTSLTWGGQLLPLPEDADWPVTPAELAPYAAEAEGLLGVDGLAYDAPAFFAKLQRSMPDLLAEVPEVDRSLSKFAPFGQRNLARSLGEVLREHPKARVIFRAQATELLLAPARDRIEAVLVRGVAGERVRVEAERFVVAAGTVETVRLLLASRSVARDGIGNGNDQVGRNFHDHLTVTAATIQETARGRVLAALRPWVTRGTVHGVKLAASARLRAELGLTPVLAHLTIDEPESSGVAVLRGLLRVRQREEPSRAFREAAHSLPRAIFGAAHLAWSARVEGRRYVSPGAAVRLRLNAAQEAPSASRIMLAEELDVAGQPKAALDWRIEMKEVATLRAFAGHLRANLEYMMPRGLEWKASLFGDQRNEHPAELDDARHAMGGACMGTDERSSVVTPELRVHGLNNLYLASAATFPDGSPQLPTLPLMALTLRLAEHLHRGRPQL